MFPFGHVSVDSGSPTGQVVSSIETLLRNIQGLLKVAADNARQQERQISIEKGELNEIVYFYDVFGVLVFKKQISNNV